MDAAEAQLKRAHDLVGFTELKADASGVVTAVGAEPGEVVQAGQMIVRLARQDGRDAVFDVPGQALRSAPADAAIIVNLSDAPAVKATGRIREVAPQPAVWIIDPSNLTASIRNIDVARFDPASVSVSQGLDIGEIVVTAGVQALHPGQKVRLLGAER